jgi:hypothetical protein
MHEFISSQPSWDTLLAPRILLGLWHPKFIQQAKDILPYCKRSYLGHSVYIAKNYFWDHVEAFSMAFPYLANPEGERFVHSWLSSNVIDPILGTDFGRNAGMRESI